jgi:hypothetical protein
MCYTFLSCIEYCARDSAPVWQLCIAAPLSLLVGGVVLLSIFSDPDGSSGWWWFALLFGVVLTCTGIKSYFDVYEKMTIDVSPGAYVSICDDIPKSCQAVGNTTKNHVGQVQAMGANGLISVNFPLRKTTDGKVVGGTLNIKKPILRQSTAAAYNAQPLAEPQQGYVPPMLEQQPDMSRGYPMQQQMMPMQQQPSVPPTAIQATPAVALPATVPTATSLTDFLAEARLEQYETALRDLGCAQVADLQDLEEADCMEMGMKKIEVKRLRRIAPQ